MDISQTQIFQSLPLKHQTQQRIRIEYSNGFHVKNNPFEICLALKNKLSTELQSFIKQDLYSSPFHRLFLALNFSPEFIQHLIPQFEEKFYNKGEFIFRTGDIPEDLFFLISGTITQTVSRRDITIPIVPALNEQIDLYSEIPKEHIIANISQQQTLNSDEFFKQQVGYIASRASTDCLVGCLSYLKFKRALQIFENDRQNYFQLKDKLNLYGKSLQDSIMNQLSVISLQPTKNALNEQSDNETPLHNFRNGQQLGFLKNIRNNKKFNTFQHFYQTKFQAWRIFLSQQGQLQSNSSFPSSPLIPPSFLADELFEQIIPESQYFFSAPSPPPVAFRETKLPQETPFHPPQPELNSQQNRQEYHHSETQNQFQASSSSFSFSDDPTNAIISDPSIQSPPSFRNQIPLSPLKKQSNNFSKQNINELITSNPFAPQYYYPYHIIPSLKKKILQQQPICEYQNTIQKFKAKDQIIEELKLPYPNLQQSLLPEFQSLEEQSLKYSKQIRQDQLQKEDESMCQAFSHSSKLLESNIQLNQDEPMIQSCDSFRLSNHQIISQLNKKNLTQDEDKQNPLFQDIFFNSFETMQSYARYFPHNNVESVIEKMNKHPIHCNYKSNFFEPNSNSQEKETQQGVIAGFHLGNKYSSQKTYKVNDTNTQFVMNCQKEQSNVDVDRQYLYLGISDLIQSTQQIKNCKTMKSSSSQVINSQADCCSGLPYTHITIPDQSKDLVESVPACNISISSLKNSQFESKEKLK